MCKSCYNTYLRSKVRSAVLYLVILVVAGIIGYLLNPKGTDAASQPEVSSYMLMATFTGFYILSGKMRIPAIAFLAAGANNVGFMMLLVLLVKFFIAVTLGLFLLPFIILWQILVIVCNLSRITVPA